MVSNAFWNAFTASIIACAITFLGIYAIHRVHNWARQKMGYFVSFAAGVLIAISFLHLIPTAMEMTHKAPFFFLGGYFAIYIINRYLTAFVCEQDEESYDCPPDNHPHAHTIHHDCPPEEDHHPHQHHIPVVKPEVGLIPMIGIGFHSLIDGMIYTITFQVSFLTGILAFIGLVLHEFPEGIITYLLLVHSGYSKKRSILWAAIAAGLTTPLGMLISYPAVLGLDEQTLGILLALSAGMLMYVGASHLLPEIEKHHSRYSFLALGAGILVSVLLFLLESAHGH